MFGDLIRSFAVARFLLSSVSLAQGTCSTTSNKYFVIPGFAASRGCVPSGYLAAADAGNTNPSALTTFCENGCTNFNRCKAFVAQVNKAADSGLYSGTCFYYGSPVPTSPRQCADAPSDLIAEQRDSAVACFSSSASAATAFCSSYLSIPTVTSYTTTVTPTTTTTSTSSSLTTQTTTTTTSTTTSTTSTAVSTSTTVSSLTSLTTTTSVFASTSTSTVFTTTLSSTIVPAGSNKLRVRQNSPARPSCIPSYEPASIISSACSCLSIKPTTIRTASTAGTVTSRSTTLTTSTSRPVSTIISSTTSVIVTTSTTITTSFVTTSSTISTTTSTITTTTTSDAYCQFVPGDGGGGGYDTVLTPQVNSAQDCCNQCAQNPGCAIMYYGNDGGDCELGVYTNLDNCLNMKQDIFIDTIATVAVLAVGPCGIRRSPT